MTRTIPARAAKFLLVQCFRMAPFYHADPAASKRANRILRDVAEIAENRITFQVGIFRVFGFFAGFDGIKIEFKIAVSPAPALGEMQKPNAFGF